MRNKQKIDVLIGIVVGFFANVLGILLWALLFSDLSVIQTFIWAYQEGLLSAIIGMGALLDLLVFFGFLRFSYDHRAKGVLIWTFVAAFTILYLKIS